MTQVLLVGPGTSKPSVLKILSGRHLREFPLAHLATHFPLIVMTGVLVIRPDESVFQDLLAKMPKLSSYDGGDTGTEAPHVPSDLEGPRKAFPLRVLPPPDSGPSYHIPHTFPCVHRQAF